MGAVMQFAGVVFDGREAAADDFGAGWLDWFRHVFEAHEAWGSRKMRTGLKLRTK